MHFLYETETKSHVTRKGRQIPIFCPRFLLYIEKACAFHAWNCPITSIALKTLKDENWSQPTFLFHFSHSYLTTEVYAYHVYVSNPTRIWKPNDWNVVQGIHMSTKQVAEVWLLGLVLYSTKCLCIDLASQDHKPKHLKAKELVHSL